MAAQWAAWLVLKRAPKLVVQKAGQMAASMVGMWVQLMAANLVDQKDNS